MGANIDGEKDLTSFASQRTEGSAGNFKRELKGVSLAHEESFPVNLIFAVDG